MEKLITKPQQRSIQSNRMEKLLKYDPKYDFCKLDLSDEEINLRKYIFQLERKNVDETEKLRLMSRVYSKPLTEILSGLKEYSQELSNEFKDRKMVLDYYSKEMPKWRYEREKLEIMHHYELIESLSEILYSVDQNEIHDQSFENYFISNPVVAKRIVNNALVLQKVYGKSLP